MWKQKNDLFRIGSWGGEEAVGCKGLKDVCNEKKKKDKLDDEISEDA